MALARATTALIDADFAQDPFKFQETSLTHHFQFDQWVFDRLRGVTMYPAHPTGLGFLSGLTGVGGGIFLSPLLLFLGWADVRKTAGVSVVFILVNSASGLLGHLPSVKNVPHEIAAWAPAALIGGFIGSELGSRRLAPMTRRRLVAVVLVVAGVKMLVAP